MCEIEKICGDDKGIECLSNYYEKLRDETQNYYENKISSFALIIKEIYQSLTDAKFEDVHNELELLRITIEENKEESFDLLDLGLAILMIFPATFAYGLVARILKTSVTKVFISANRRLGNKLNPLRELIKKADNKFMDVALALDFPEIYDETISYSKKKVGSEFEKGTEKILKQINKNINSTSNSDQKSDVGKPLYTTISEYQSYFSSQMKLYEMSNNQQKKLRYNSLTDIKSSYSKNETDDLTCYFYSEYIETKLINNLEFSTINDIAILSSLIVLSFDKSVFFHSNYATENLENYDNYNQLHSAIGTGSTYFQGQVPARDNTATEYSPPTPGYDVYRKGNLELTTQDDALPILQNNPIANQLLILLKKYLNREFSTGNTATTILKDLNLTTVQFLLKAYERKELLLNE